MKNLHISTAFERIVDDALSTGTHFDEKKNQLTINRNYGFFSNCSVTLWALTKIYPSESFVKVNWSSEDRYRDNDQAGKNLFDLYFEQNAKADTHQLSPLSPVNHHGIYAELPFQQLNPYIQSYFVPSAVVQKRQKELLQKYNIDCEKTISLCYRGTDKWTEIAPIPPRFYINETRRLLANRSDLRVLVQTDQEQVRKQCLAYFGERAFYFDEMPVTSSSIAIDHISQEFRKISNFEFGVTLLAVVNLIANCKYVVSHTGNVGLWIYLFRGNAEGMCQLRPRPPDRVSNLPDEISRVANQRGHPVSMKRYISILEDEVDELESENVQFRTENTLLRSESREIRRENTHLLSELNDIRNSVIYKNMKHFASKIDNLFPNETTRGTIRKHLAHRLRARSSP
jgi:hypothetical protein